MNPLRACPGSIGAVLLATLMSSANADQPGRLDDQLARVLREAGFTGRVTGSNVTL